MVRTSHSRGTAASASRFLGAVRTAEVPYFDELAVGQVREHGGLAHLRSPVRAVGADEPARDVLDWRYAVVLA